MAKELSSQRDWVVTRWRGEAGGVPGGYCGKARWEEFAGAASYEYEAPWSVRVHRNTASFNPIDAPDTHGVYKGLLPQGDQN